MQGKNKKTISEIVGYFGNFTELTVNSDNPDVNPVFSYSNEDRHPYNIALVLDGVDYIINNAFVYNGHLVLNINSGLVSFTIKSLASDLSKHAVVTKIDKSFPIYPNENIINISKRYKDIGVVCKLPLEVYLNLASI